MTRLAAVHESHDARLEQRGGRRVVAEYGRPDRAHAAVRNAAGVIEHCQDVLVVTGTDRREYVDNAVSNAVPETDGEGVYALLLDPQGRISTEMYVFNAGERLLILTPPGEGSPLADEWRKKTFIQDVEFDLATESFVLLGVHGSQATEKIASVFSEGTPETQLSFVRGSMGDAGVTVIRTDALTGEEGYLVVGASDDAPDLFDTLENRGMNAAPFGYRTWDSLTLEAGTPCFATELDTEIPNSLGLANAIDYEKGCFVGQEVVSRIENRGRPAQRLVGLTVDAVPASGAAVFAGDESVGAITRGVASPTLDRPIALALVDYDVGDCLVTDHTDGNSEDGSLTVRIDGTERAATLTTLPFVDGSDRSARIPQY